MILIFMGWGKSGELFLHAVSNAWEHSGTARQHSVAVQVFTDIDIAFHDRVVGRLVNTGRLHAQERRLEDRLWATEALVTDGDDLSVCNSYDFSKADEEAAVCISC